MNFIPTAERQAKLKARRKADAHRRLEKLLGHPIPETIQQETTMNDFRNIFETKHLSAWELNGDTPVTITRIDAETVGWGKKAARKPVFYFLELKKGMICNKINADIIGKLHNTYDPDDLLGKTVVLYPTTTEMQGAIVDCIRVRPKGFVPRGTPANQARQVNAVNRQQQQPPQQPQPQTTTINRGANPFPPATQADQLVADEAFRIALEQELTRLGFTPANIDTFTADLCRTMAIADVYALPPAQRTSLLGKISSGRYNRFITRNGSPQTQVA